MPNSDHKPITISNKYLEENLDRYWSVLQNSQLADKSVEDYYYFAFCFVRWMEGTFTPGSNVKP